MSAEDSVNERSRRRRGLRRPAEVTPVEGVDIEDEIDDEEEDDDSVSSSRGITAKKGYATPSRRKQEEIEEQAEGNVVTRPLNGLRDYIDGVRSEVQKVVWPTREEVRRLTLIVLVSTVIASLVLGLISLLFNQLFAFGIRTPIIFGVVLVVVLGAFFYYLRNSNRRSSTY